MRSILLSVVLLSSVAFAQTSTSYAEQLSRAKFGRSTPAVEQAAKAAKAANAAKAAHDKPVRSCGDCCKR